jgi:cob(I)alamin adenosyltransferase
LPAGSAEIAHTHVARCVCRRAERLIVQLDELQHVDPNILKYVNRLSDYLFVLARKVAQVQGIAEVNWKPRV